MLFGVPDQLPDALKPFLPAAPYPPLDAGLPLPSPGLDAALTNWIATCRDRDAGWACAAALWLGRNDLDRSHTVSQGLDTREGSRWHGIMHRREGDYGNANYWFRRAGSHVIDGQIPMRLGELPMSAAVPSSLRQHWQATAFTAWCESLARQGDRTNEAAVAVQQIEWELLFNYSLIAAVGN